MICSFARDGANKLLLLVALSAVAVLGVLATRQPASAACIIHPFGEVASSRTLSGDLKSGDCIASWSGSRKWTDYIRFTLATPQEVTINLSSNDVDPYLVLFSWDGNRSTVLSRDDDSGQGNDARISHQLEAGTYYTAATKRDVQAGSYSLQISITGLSLDDPIVRREIAEMYKPILHFDSREQYYPVPIKAMFDYSTLKVDRYYGEFTLSTIPTARGLAEYGRRESQADQFLDFDVNSWDSARPAYTPTAYVHVREINRRVYVQYWYFYVYNLGPPLWNWCEIGQCWYPQQHDGDWESVQVVFPADAKVNEILEGTVAPEEMWFAAHESGTWRPWANVFKDVSRIRPYVYVALGSHASFPIGGWNEGTLDDINDYDGLVIGYYTVELIDDNTDWVGWDGRWGKIGELGNSLTSAPRGPGSKSQWDWE